MAESPNSGSATVTRQFNQFPNFHSHQQGNKDVNHPNTQANKNQIGKNKSQSEGKRSQNNRKQNSNNQKLAERPRQSEQRKNLRKTKEKTGLGREEEEVTTPAHAPTSSSGVPRVPHHPPNLSSPHITLCRILLPYEHPLHLMSPRHATCHSSGLSTSPQLTDPNTPVTHHHPTSHPVSPHHTPCHPVYPGLTIEEFLTRYPEVKRLSSR